MRDPWKECKEQKSNLLGISTTDVQFQKRIVYVTNEIEFSRAVVEFPKMLNFCCGLEAQLQCATLGRCGHFEILAGNSTLAAV